MSTTLRMTWQLLLDKLRLPRKLNQEEDHPGIQVEFKSIRSGHIPLDGDNILKFPQHRILHATFQDR